MIVGLGIDVAGIARMEQLLARHRQRFLDRWFDPRELPACTSAERIAARWAAKEAAAKALGTGFTEGIVPSQIAVLSQPSGAPVLHLAGAALARAQALGATRFHVSLSHADGTAVATVILESLPPGVGGSHFRLPNDGHRQSSVRTDIPAYQPQPPTPNPRGNG